MGETTATSDEKRDGLLIEDTAVGISTEIMCSNSLPTLRIRGDKATTSVVQQLQVPCAGALCEVEPRGRKAFGWIVVRGPRSRAGCRSRCR